MLMDQKCELDLKIKIILMHDNSNFKCKFLDKMQVQRI